MPPSSVISHHGPLRVQRPVTEVFRLRVTGRQADERPCHTASVRNSRGLNNCSQPGILRRLNLNIRREWKAGMGVMIQDVTIFFV